MNDSDSASLPMATSMGEVSLTVSHLDRSVEFWQESIGLAALERTDGRALLGAGTRPLVELVEQPGARPGSGYTGLFHLALLVPTRVDLARWLRHATDAGVGLDGFADHFVSEAIYLHDPDGHGIEIYHDRPRHVWEGRVAQMTTAPLDLHDLLAEIDAPNADGFSGLPPGTVMGHVHLRVHEIPAAVAFYRDVLGFTLTATYGSQAAFLAAGGYHHHIAANTWQSRNAAPAPAGTAALRHATIVFPDAPSRDAAVARVAAGGQEVALADGIPLVRDPSHNALCLAA